MLTGLSLKSILPVTLIAMAIAACLPFDRGLQAVTGGNTAAHVLLVGVLALAGGSLATRAGLRTGGDVRVGACVAVCGAAYVLLIDGVLLRSMMQPATVALIHTPLTGRLLAFMARAFNENMIYRLFGLSAVMVVLRHLWRGGRVPAAMVVLAGLLIQGLNVWINVYLPASHGPGPAELAYWLVRYVAPGGLWAWLYWRHGFITAEVASVGGHLVLQPLYTLLV